MSEFRTVRPAKAEKIILKAMSKKRPIFMWGPPGIGKSEIVDGIGKSGKLGNCITIDLRLALMEPTDIKGYPFLNQETNKMEWAPAADLPDEELAAQYDSIILFLDELNSAPQSVQAAAYQLILNRKIGAYKLPDNVVIVAAGNRETDRGVTFRMPSPLANRFVHVEMSVNFEDWQQWAVKNDVDADVVGFLSYNKGDLYDFDPKSSSRSFATPRSWTYVSDLLDDDLDDELNTELVAGSVGEGMAIKFMAHRKISSKMPHPEKILEGKVKELKVKEISAMYSLTVALCYELKAALETKAGADAKWHTKVNNFLSFMMDFFEPEMVILGAKTAISDYDLPIRYRDLDKTVYKKFAKNYGKYIVES